jgi:nucleotide-binding universal stress UspA family protein
VTQLPYRNVVVGTDGSPTAERAVRQAGRLAGDAGARLVVVTAFSSDPHADHSLEDRLPEDIRWMLADRSQAEARAQHGRELAKAEGATNVVVQTAEGDAPTVLIDTAKDFDAELIVVGSVGLTSKARLLLGSVASAVGHHAPCDVLIVHTA